MRTLSENQNNRTIICHTLHRKNQSGQLGFIQPIAEIINGNIQSIDTNNFCQTLKVFITHQYEDLENLYPDGKIFQINIRLSTKNSENLMPEMSCDYVASASDASPIKQKDFFEVIDHPLPIASNRIITPVQLPATDYIFIKDGEYTYGPFSWNQIRDSSEITIDFPNDSLPSVSLAPYQTYLIETSKIEKIGVKFPKINRTLVRGLSFLQNTEYLDYASDEEITNYCVKIASNLVNQTIEKSKLDLMNIRLVRNAKLNNELNRNRLRRMAEITEITESLREEISKSIGHFLNSKHGKPIVQKFIEQNESLFMEKLRKEKEKSINQDLSRLMLEVDKAESRIIELNEKKALLNDQIQALNIERENESDFSKIHAQSDEALRAKRAEFDEIDSNIKSLAKIHNLVLRIDDLNADIRSRERQLKEAEARAEQAHEITRVITTTMSEKNIDLQRRMAELKPFVEAINGSFAPQVPNQEILAVETRNLSSESTTSRQKTVIEIVRTELESKGRQLSENKVANILITLQQSFLTIFAGLPGTGKTSLARLIADAQNIKPRLREIAVSRGWTSQKDLIGYYNPLTNRFQPASTGMYGFLKALASETNTDRAMAYILLDEANLSPIEHYWSSFMGISDNENDRQLIIGNETLNILNNIRFIATINYDGTTEPLSPRLINRAPIILLDAPKDLINAKTTQKTIERNAAISANQMNELFGMSSTTPDLNGNERSVYEKIKYCLLDNDPGYGRPVTISPRKENAIHQYCAKARMLMNIDSDLTALDFAIQQHILPLIHGTGPKFAKRLDSLQSILINNDLLESSKILQGIITSGEADLQTYDFFCW